MPPRIYADSDADLACLSDRIVTVIGYGRQGEAQAMNMRDSGIDHIIIGNRDDQAGQSAKAAGFDVRPVGAAAAAGDVVLLLIPDEIQPQVFDSDIRPGLRAGDVLVVASGYNLTFDLLEVPEEVDAVMVAPRMIGAGVRTRFLSGQGFPCFVSVEQNPSGTALGVALAVAKAIGATRTGAIESSAREEVSLDLFTELAIGPAILAILSTAYDTLHEAGFSDEAVLHEMYLSGELGEVIGRAATDGLFGQLELHSRTSQYAHLRGFAAMPSAELRHHFATVLRTDILSGAFAEEWSNAPEDPLAKLRRLGQPLPLAVAEHGVRQRLAAPEQIPDDRASPTTALDLSAAQRDIYDRGTGGVAPRLPVDLDELEELARGRLPDAVFGFLAGGAGREQTIEANRRAFGRWAIVPRMLRDVGVRDHRTKILETIAPAPLLLAPLGTHRTTHPDGELAVARAARSAGIPLIVSTVSSYSLERIADELAGTPGWFQLYWPGDRALAESLLHRAHQAGYEALVVTLDNMLMGWRPRDLQRGFLPFLRGDGLANYLSDPVFQKQLGARSEADIDLRGAIARWSEIATDPTLTWDDLGFLRENWPGPIVLKGILHPDDAHRAVDTGIDGIAVSNHGGRQVDGAVAALDALPGIAESVHGKATVLFDGGIRNGSDMVKALALGADAVAIGRPYIYGLALAGQNGVEHVLRTLLADYDLTCGLAGHTGPRGLGPGALTRSQT